MDLDSRLMELGAEPMDGDQFVAMTEEELMTLEARLNVRLPSLFREFLSRYGAVYFGPVVMFHPVQPLPPYLSPGDSPIDFIYGSEKNKRSLIQMLRSYSHRMPESIIPIGGNIGGNRICLGIRGAEMEKVYYWDHHHEWDDTYYLNHGLPVPADIKFQNVHLIAESFEDFLKRLYVVEE